MFDPNSKLVRYSELMPGKSAFVDARTPGSHLKENFCIIGKGVAENPAQPIHIREVTGFHVGAAGQPPGILNSLHSHFTAEIFMVFKGSFRFFWGAHGDHEVTLHPGDVLSVPVRCFRGFEVVGDVYGFVFVVLGGQNAGGGIEWHPDVLLEGRKHGLYLLWDKTLVDTAAGETVPNESKLFQPMSRREAEAYNDFSAEEMLRFVSLAENRQPGEPFSPEAGFTQYNISGDPDADEDFDIRSRDGVCIYGYGTSAGRSVPLHRRREKQVLQQFSGDVELAFDDSSVPPMVLTPGDTFDLPQGTGFSLRGMRGDSVTYCFVHGSNPTKPEMV